MMIQVGEVGALFRYPIKSMAGEALQAAELGWHGLLGDRRLALRRLGDRGGFPWLTATRLPELILHAPVRQGEDRVGDLPTHVRTPGGQDLPLFGEELAMAIGTAHGSPVEMIHLDRGIFDEATISAITASTVDALAELVGHDPDVRRFRPNLVISSLRSEPFEEDAWVGGVLSFGEGEATAAITVTHRDERCSMVNLDPDTGTGMPEVLKTVVRERSNQAGVYGSVLRPGRLEVGQPIYLTPTKGRLEDTSP